MPEGNKETGELLAPVLEVRETKDAAGPLKQKLLLLYLEISASHKDLIKLRGHVQVEEAKAYVDEQAAFLQGDIKKIADAGRELIAKKEANPSLATFDRLKAGLHAKLEAQKKEVKNFGEIKRIDESRAAVKKQYESLDRNKPADEQIAERKTVLASLNQMFAVLPQTPATEKYRVRLDLVPNINALKSQITADLAVLTLFKADKARLAEKESKIKELEKMIGKYENAELDEEKKQIGEKIKAQISGLNLAALGEELFKGRLGEAKGGLESALYQQLWKNEYSQAKRALEGIASRLHGNESKPFKEDALKKVEGMNNAIKQSDSELKKYDALIREINSEWEKAPETKKKECEALEANLLKGFATGRAVLSDLQSRMDELKINPAEIQGFNECSRTITINISRIESFKQERILRKYLKKQGLDNLVGFAQDENGVRTPAFSSQSKDDDKSPIIQYMANETKMVAQMDTSKMEMEFRLSQGQKGIDSLKQQLGPKSEKFFEGMNKIKNNDRAGALVSLNEYLHQTFTDQDSKMHTVFREQANEIVATVRDSADYYAAMQAITAGKSEEAVKLFNQYLASSKKLSPNNKEKHQAQIDAANEALKKIGLERINLVEDLYSDVLRLHEAAQKLGGNLALKPKEGVESTVIKQAIAKLRERINSGECKNFYEEYANIKAQIEAQKLNPDNNILAEMSGLYEALNSTDPAIRQKALIEFAKKARTMRGYELSRKYLEYALEDRYKQVESANGKEKTQQNKEEILGKMTTDPKIVAWIKQNAKAQYEHMRAQGNLPPTVTLQQIEQQLFQRKLNDVYLASLRQQMTLAGLAGEQYRAIAQGSIVEAWRNVITPNSGVVMMAGRGADEALILYNEYFKETESHWYNPTTWGAEDWDEFEDECIKFAFETVLSFGVGMGAGAVGEKVGAGVLRALARRGLSEAAVAAIEKGGFTALRTVLKSEAKVMAAYAIKQGAVLSAEGATFFVLGTIQGGLLDAEGTNKQLEQNFSSLGRGMGTLGEQIAVAAAFKVMGAAGQKILGNNPDIVRILAQESISGVLGTAIGQAGELVHGRFDGRSFARGVFQNAVQAGGTRPMHGKSGPAKANRKMEEAGVRHDIEKINKEFEANLSPKKLYSAANPAPPPKHADIPAPAENTAPSAPGRETILPPQPVSAPKTAVSGSEKSAPSNPKQLGPEHIVVRPSGEIGPVSQNEPTVARGAVIEQPPISSSERQSVAPMSEQAAAIIKALSTGKIHVSRVVDDMVSGRLPQDPAIIDAVLAHTDRDVPSLVGIPNHKLSAGQQSRLVDLDISLSIVLDETTKLVKIKEGTFDTIFNKIDAGLLQLSAVVDRLLTYEMGRVELEERLRHGLLQDPSIAEKVARNVLKDKSISDRFRIILKNDKNAFGTSRNIVEKNLISAIARRDDGELIKTRGQKNQKGLRSDISKHIAEGLTGTGDDLVNVLRGIKARDPQGYRILENNIQSIDINYLQAVVEGNFTEWPDGSGRIIRAYKGGDIGMGGMGTVSHVLYTVDGGTEVRHAVIKSSHETTREFFRKEGDGGERVEDWYKQAEEYVKAHPGTDINDMDISHINRALHRGDDFIIYETGPNARTLSKEFATASPAESIKLFIDVLKAIREYQRQGYFHGDIKSENVIVFDTPNGPKAILIDNTPIGGSKNDVTIRDKQHIPRTKGLFPEDQLDNLYNNPKDVYLCVDPHSGGKMLEDLQTIRKDVNFGSKFRDAIQLATTHGVKKNANFVPYLITYLRLLLAGNPPGYDKRLVKNKKSLKKPSPKKPPSVSVSAPTNLPDNLSLL